EGLRRSTPFASLTSARMTEMGSSASLEAADRAVAGEAGARLREAGDAAKAETQTKADIAEGEKDLERMREHMKALSGERPGGGGPNPFAARVLAAEDKLTALRKKQDTFRAD